MGDGQSRNGFGRQFDVGFGADLLDDPDAVGRAVVPDVGEAVLPAPGHEAVAVELARRGEADAAAVAAVLLIMLVPGIASWLPGIVYN